MVQGLGLQGLGLGFRGFGVWGCGFGDRFSGLQTPGVLGFRVGF